MGKESNAVCFKPLSASTKEYAVFVSDPDLVSSFVVGLLDVLLKSHSHSFAVRKVVQGREVHRYYPLRRQLPACRSHRESPFPAE